MRLQLLSDLHLEFHRDEGVAFVDSIPVTGDVLVLAGDITNLLLPERTEQLLRRLCARFPEVLWVAGNHEFYGTSGQTGSRVLASLDAAIDNLHVLDARTVTLDGVRFVGVSLWFPTLEGEERLRGFLSDFSAISDALEWIPRTHARDLAFLEREIRPGDVVVTHHLPHPRSVASQFAGSPLNRFFLAEDAAPLVETRGAALWLHGHTHEPCDYVVGKTRVVCHPMGYLEEHRGRAYDPGRTIEVPR